MPFGCCFGRFNQVKPLLRATRCGRHGASQQSAHFRLHGHTTRTRRGLPSQLTFACTDTQHGHGAASPLNDDRHDTRRHAAPPRRTRTRGALARRCPLPRALCRAAGEPLPSALHERPTASPRRGARDRRRATATSCDQPVTTDMETLRRGPAPRYARRSACRASPCQRPRVCLCAKNTP